MNGYLRWPLDAKNQPCGFRIEESPFLFADMQPPKENPYAR